MECQCGHAQTVHNLMEGRCHDQSCDCPEFTPREAA